jgi:hypothetical protein
MQTQRALCRKWKASITTRIGTPPILVSDPLTIEFNYRKNVTGQLNQGSFRVYNLNRETRRQIEFDRFLTQSAKTVGSNTSLLYNQLNLPFSLMDGFEGGTPTIAFSGNIQKAYSSKQGVDIITQIDCVDGMFGINNSYGDLTVDTPVTTKEIIEFLVGSLNNVEKGYISNLPTVPLPYFSFNGRVFDKIKQLTNGLGSTDQTCADCFIDNGKIHILSINEGFVNRGILVFNADNIIGSPRATGSYIEFDIVYTSDLRLGQIIELQTNINSFINGQYKIVSLSGSGTFGDSQIGSNITTVQVFRPIDFSLIPIFASI